MKLRVIVFGCYTCRDLKMNNVLCREENGQLWVALSDFGSCLVTDLQVPYYTDQILKGGNWSHLAPEVSY